MKISSLFFVLSFVCQLSNTEYSMNPSLEADALSKGTWQVDLRPTPESEPYFKDFVIREVKGTFFSGEFYDTPFDNGRMNTQWDRTHFAFTTSDQSSMYFHSGYIMDGKMHGVTYCPERNFTMPWTASQE